MTTDNIKQLKKRLQDVHTYEEWKTIALVIDQATGMEEWKQKPESEWYDYEEIELRLEQLRKTRKEEDDLGLLFILNEGIHGNMGGMGNTKLHTKAMAGTKQLIEDYVHEIRDSLLHLANVKNKSISFEEKLDFFRRASHCFGRSALMLSGGGQLGNFHLGVLKALALNDLLPDVISGSSAGSIFAALVGTHNNDELEDFFEEGKLIEEIKQGAKMYKKIEKAKDSVSIKDLENIVNSIIPNMTFQEAYSKTGRKINISVAPLGALQKSRLLNAVASPNVLIRSAVMASCAIPGVFPPITLSAKNKKGEIQSYLPSRKWIDGSMSNDLPTKRLTRLYSVNHFIVSLTNPLVIPFVSDPSRQNDFMASVKRFGSAIIKETTQFNYSIAKRFFKRVPSLALVASNINSIVQQDYIGDINIIADFNILRPNKVLSALSYEELSELIIKGEKATWHKMEAIRVTTTIGRVLDKILEDYETKEQQLVNKALKKR